jgi:hypothetical protein
MPERRKSESRWKSFVSGSAWGKTGMQVVINYVIKKYRITCNDITCPEFPPSVPSCLSWMINVWKGEGEIII